MTASSRLACTGARERARHARAAAVARVVAARRRRDEAEHALLGLRSPAAVLVLAAHFTGPTPDARALLERRAERAADAHAEAMRGLGCLLSEPTIEGVTS